LSTTQTGRNDNNVDGDAVSWQQSNGNSVLDGILENITLLRTENDEHMHDNRQELKAIRKHQEIITDEVIGEEDLHD